MTEHDLLEVVEIEMLSGLSPWGWDAYHKELQSEQDVILLVARTQAAGSGPCDAEGIVGFIISRLIAGELHVNNVAVRSEFRRQGIAAQLLAAVLDWGRRHEARMALLEVRSGNTAAQALYSRCGFQVVGRRRRYYSQPVEDALLMSISLSASP
jgi:ribosomal-protein-alanine N-acetyltransferase